MRWNLTGTTSQVTLAQSALDDIKFPWDRLNISWRPEMGWRDLNSRYAAEPQRVSLDNQFRHGQHLHDTGHEGAPEPLNGELEGRRFTYAVFYPGSARIYIDHRLEQYPTLARASVSAEVAHAVDEFVPLTERQREEIIVLLGGTPGEMTWWERFNYGTEYWTLAGEHFMPLFTNAYSSIPFGNTSSFSHDPTKVNPDDLIRIMGIQRTDYVPPTPPPPPPPPEPVIQPEEVIIPMPDPERHDQEYRTFGKSRIVHRPSHYAKKTKFNIIMSDHIPDGYRACKVCKPQ